MDERPEIRRKGAPGAGFRTDDDSAMDALERNRLALPGDADDTTVTECLTRWDELAPEGLERLAGDPVHGARLDHVRRAEEWLVGRAPTPGPCPEAGELYDYGRGPGYRALSSAHRSTVERHLAQCSLCESFVETLDSSPPLPLDVAGTTSVAPPAPGGTPKRPPASRRPRVLRFAPLAAAAAVLVTSLVFFGPRDRAGAGSGLPEFPLLRGEAADALLFPRGQVLVAGDDRFASTPLFELRPVEGASTYRVVLARHDGGAFEAGEEILRLEGEKPQLASGSALGPGNYTWEAWAVVDGLDRRLGARDFRVVEDVEFRGELSELEGEARVRALHRAGFLTDARHATRALPESDERTRYLGTPPGR